MKRGFTLVELLLGMTVFILLTSFLGLNALKARSSADLVGTVSVFKADLKSTQQKAMAGAISSGGPVNGWGIHLGEHGYTIFPGTVYSESAPGNVTVTLPTSISLSTTLPGNNLIFARSSGDVLSYSAGSDTMTFTTDAKSSVLKINSRGVFVNP